jgi:uncharacterized protein (UPF0335 family)
MEPTEQEVAEAQVNDVFPELAHLEKSVADIKGDIRELFSRLSDLAQDVNKLKEKN